MNAICCATSGCIQCGGRNGVPENRVTRVKSGKMHQAHHVKGRKVHQANGSAPAKHS